MMINIVSVKGRKQPVLTKVSLKNLSELVKNKKYIYNSKDDIELFYVPAVLLNGFRGSEYVSEYTGYYGIDIDIDVKKTGVDKYNLSEIQKSEIRKDLEIIKTFLKQFCAFIKVSFSGTGFHIICSGPVVDNADDYKKNWALLELNINAFLWKRFDLKYSVDQATKDIVRGLYLTHDPSVIYNEDLDGLDIISAISGVESVIVGEYKRFLDVNDEVVDYSNIDYIKVKNDNDAFLEKLLKYKDLPEVIDYINKTFSFRRHNTALFYALKNSNDAIISYFYDYFVRNYVSSGGTTKSFIKVLSSGRNAFIDFIKNFKSKGDKQKMLKPYFKDCLILMVGGNFINGTSEDFFRNKYTTILKRDKYISNDDLEYVELVGLLKDKINIIKADAGGGKTTFIKRYINQEYISKNILFLSAKTSLLDQIYNSYIGSSFSLIKNYEPDKNELKLESLSNNIVFSTINSVNKVRILLDFDLVIYDECHLLVDFSSLDKKTDKYTELYDYIYELFKSDTKQIYISATPDKFVLSLMGMPINYININMNNKKVIIDKIIESNDLVGTMRKTFERYKGNTNIIYFNDVKKIEKFVNGGIESNKCFSDFRIIDASRKDEPYVKNIVNNQTIEEGYNYMTTSYIGEGLNINNDGLLTLIIVDNGSDPANIYQFISRFRNRNIKVYYLTTFRKPRFNGELYDFKNNFEVRKEPWVEYVSNNKRSILDSMFLESGKTNLFKICYEVILEGMNYIKGDRLYYMSYIKYLFDVNKIEYVKSVDVKESLWNREKLTDDDKIWFKKNLKNMSAILNNTYIIKDPIESEYVDCKIDLFSRIYKQYMTVYNLVESIGKTFDFNDYEFIFCEGLEYNKKVKILKVNEVMINKDKYNSSDIYYIADLEKVIEYIKNNKINGRKYDYVKIDDVKDYIIKNKLKYIISGDKIKKESIQLIINVVGGVRVKSNGEFRIKI